MTRPSFSRAVSAAMAAIATITLNTMFSDRIEYLCRLLRSRGRVVLFVGSAHAEQRAHSIPHDLHADTHENERRQAKDHAHGSLPDHALDGFRKTIRQVDGDREDRASDERRRGQSPMSLASERPVRTDRDRYG